MYFKTPEITAGQEFPFCNPYQFFAMSTPTPAEPPAPNVFKVYKPSSGSSSVLGEEQDDEGPSNHLIIFR
jgi:hypothetical protein